MFTVSFPELITEERSGALNLKLESIVFVGVPVAGFQLLDPKLAIVRSAMLNLNWTLLCHFRKRKDEETSFPIECYRSYDR